MNFGFDPKMAWARRGDDWKGRKEPEHTGVFHQFQQIRKNRRSDAGSQKIEEIAICTDLEYTAVVR